MDLNREVWSNAALALRVCWFQGIGDFCFGSFFRCVGCLGEEHDYFSYKSNKKRISLEEGKKEFAPFDVI